MLPRGPKNKTNDLTKEFIDGTVLFYDWNNAWFQDGQQRNVLRENTKTSTEWRNVHLLHVGVVVVNLHDAKQKS